MRQAARLWAVALALSLLTGCSALIVAGGSDLSRLTTKADVQKQFGTPKQIANQDGKVCETYVSRRKIARSNGWMQGYGMLTGISLGLSEFAFFPLELGRAGQRLAVGQKIRVTYEPSGGVRVINVGGLDRIYPRVENADVANTTKAAPAVSEQAAGDTLNKQR